MSGDEEETEGGAACDASEFSWGDALPTLASERVTLRALTDDDVADLFAIFSDPEVMRYWSSPPMMAESEAATLLREIRECFREKNLFQWGVSDPTSGRVIGTCTLYRLEWPHRRAEVGFALRRSSWGKGLAAEALATLIAFAFDRMNLHRLEADADPRNARSLRLLERAGFQREGLLRERYRVSGEVQDAVVLGLLRTERPPRQPSHASDHRVP